MNAKEFLDLQDAYVEVCEQETGRGPRISDTYDERDAEGGPKGGGTIKGPKKKNVIKTNKEEVENWVNSLIEEGYDLSEYTWDEMSEIYLNEVRGGGRIDPVSDMPGIGERGARSPKDAGLEMSPLRRAEKRAEALKKRNDPEATKRANRIQSRFVKPTERAVNRSLLAATNARSAEKKRLMNPQESYEYDTFDAILEHLVTEGYADTNENALAIMANMSEEWREDIIDEAAADQSNKQIEKGVKTTYKAQNVLDNLHQGRSKGLNKLPRGEREEKAKRMSGRLKTRRDDLFGERNKREDESRAELKKKYGL